MEKDGIPSSDSYNLSTSKKSFPDADNYRIEVDGIERDSLMEAMIEEAKIGM